MINGRPALPGEDIAHFVYPMPAMLFFAPYGALPYSEARALWMTLLEVGLPALALFGISLAGWTPTRLLRASLLLFSVLWYHGLRSIVVGQFAVIEAVLMAGALLAIQRKNDRLGGVLLGLSIAKPQMPVLLIAFVIPLSSPGAEVVDSDPGTLDHFGTDSRWHRWRSSLTGRRLR